MSSSACVTRSCFCAVALLTTSFLFSGCDSQTQTSTGPETAPTEPAPAETAPAKAAPDFTYCTDDTKQFCADVQVGEGRIYHCLIDHKDQLSDACRSGLRL